MLKFDYKNTGITPEEMQAASAKVKVAYDTLVNKTGAGNDFLGWLKWPVEYDKAEFELEDVYSKVVKLCRCHE